MSITNQFTFTKAAETIPPHGWFVGSAVFHYLGPAFAVLLFPAVGVLGVAWFRIATAALVFAPITKPWRTFKQASPKTRTLLILLGICLAIMNTSFYLALERLPMSLVAAMEFIGSILIALYGAREWRNFLAAGLVIIGVIILINIKWSSDGIGLLWALLNAALFSLYVILGHKAAEGGASRGVEYLGAAMVVAFIILMPIGLTEAIKAFGFPFLILAGAGVGICSSVIPYICDQLAMSRLPRSSFALMLALLPAIATIIAAIVLAQIPTLKDILGIILVMIGVSIHIPKNIIPDSELNSGANNEV